MTTEDLDEPASPVSLSWPDARCIGGICLGTSADHLSSRGFVLDPSVDDLIDDDEPSWFMIRRHPEVSVSVHDNVIIAVTVRDECYLNGIDLMGEPYSEAAERLGGIVKVEPERLGGVVNVEPGEVAFVHTTSGVELIVREGAVQQVCISDFDLIPE